VQKVKVNPEFFQKSAASLSTLHIRLSTFLRKSRRKLATSAVVLLIVMTAYHVIFGANGILIYQQKRTEYRKLEAELKSLQEENQRIAEHVKALQTDPKAIEKEAREQLRYAKPGEVIYVAPERPQNETRNAKK
jgi:cell division protein FtsB